MNFMRIKLVIVDDAPFIREVIKNIFSHSDVDVVGEAEDGESALKVIMKTQPDVVLMDVVMPYKNGIEVAQEILKLFPHIKIIACTTLDQELMVLKALEAGCSDYVTKPFHAQDLLKAVISQKAHLTQSTEKRRE